MKAYRKSLCAFLAVLMLCALLPASAWAELEQAPPEIVTWAEDGHVFVRYEESDKVYCNGVPGEMLELSPGFEIYVRNTIDDQFLYINEIWAKRIRSAEKNGSVQINAEGWYSLNCFVSDAVKERPDVSVEFDFLDYDTQQRLSLVLPTGTDLEAQMDGKEVIEFTALAKKLGLETPAFRG